VRCVNFSLK